MTDEGESLKDTPENSVDKPKPKKKKTKIKKSTKETLKTKAKINSGEESTKVLNFVAKDAFDAVDETEGQDDSKNWRTKARKVIPRSVHIRNQQRNGRKSLTLIHGLPTDLKLPKLLRYMQKKFQTSGAILVPKDDEGNKKSQEFWVLQFQGDFRKDCYEFLLKYNVCEKEEVVLHGF